MGCFLPCFGNSKRRKPTKSSPLRIPPSSIHILKASEGVCALEQAKKEMVGVSLVDLNNGSLEKLEERIKLCDTTEKTCPVIEDDKIVVPTKEVEHNLNLDDIKIEEKSGREDDESRGSSNLSNAFSIPLNHRYAVCQNSDDDEEFVEEMDHLGEKEEERKDDADNDDGDGENKLLIKQESSESLFSLSLGSRKQVFTFEADENEINSPDPSHRSLDLQPGKASSDKISICQKENIDSVLKPIENVTHCLNAAKVATLPLVHQLEKENINLEQDCDVLISPEPTFRSMRKHVEDEIGVDTSLSNWLVESEITPKSNSNSSSIGNSPMWTRNSAKSHEDRPILGALTLEELRQFSASSTPRRNISRSPEETPIIGSVGSYWSHTGQDADSNPGSSCRGPKTTRRNREEERVNWNSTPFLERLDMALASNSAEV
ncbi:protein JASON-like [Cucumis melo var. makuwa]|uniref:Protein JASON-like n=2 Tax=Cucumis melo TaxID=3656 RepID=A0A5A7U262_CUCMM|nr:protein JASON-like [Cucumis melo var. makuwa]